MKCRLCNKTAQEINGYLVRVNELGITGIWECRPYCNCELTFDEALLEAISPPPPKRLLT